MPAIPVIAIFDVGKTNKKLFLFDENYRIVFERSDRFVETVDEDGFPCENLESLGQYIIDSLHFVLDNKNFLIKAVNFSSYGASFVYINEEGKPVAPLYNYLKPYDQELKKRFYDTYGGANNFSHQTASPILDSLNSGMQLYRIKYEKPRVFESINKAIHLPQYLAYLVSGKLFSDITSIGCHTNLWDFTKNQYHQWVEQEGIGDKLAPIIPSDAVFPALIQGRNLLVGVGLHDSSAALIPYLVRFREPFTLISTGTWCISLNPFNESPLTTEELHQDCLSFLSYQSRNVKASRLFAGNEHEKQVNRIAHYFNTNPAAYRKVPFDQDIASKLQKEMNDNPAVISLNESRFVMRDLNKFVSDIEAYHQLISDIVQQQKLSTDLVLKNSDVKTIYVDGGFSGNEIYMNMLAAAFPGMALYAASMAQASALGTALAIHRHWNKNAIPKDIIELKDYSVDHS